MNTDSPRNVNLSKMFVRTGDGIGAIYGTQNMIIVEKQKISSHDEDKNSVKQSSLKSQFNEKISTRSSTGSTNLKNGLDVNVSETTTVDSPVKQKMKSFEKLVQKSRIFNEEKMTERKMSPNTGKSMDKVWISKKKTENVRKSHNSNESSNSKNNKLSYQSEVRTEKFTQVYNSEKAEDVFSASTEYRSEKSRGSVNKTDEIDKNISDSSTLINNPANSLTLNDKYSNKYVIKGEIKSSDAQESKPKYSFIENLKNFETKGKISTESYLKPINDKNITKSSIKETVNINDKNSIEDRVLFQELLGRKLSQDGKSLSSVKTTNIEAGNDVIESGLIDYKKRNTTQSKGSDIFAQEPNKYVIKGEIKSSDAQESKPKYSFIENLKNFETKGKISTESDLIPINDKNITKSSIKETVNINDKTRIEDRVLFQELLGRKLSQDRKSLSSVKTTNIEAGNDVIENGLIDYKKRNTTQSKGSDIFAHELKKKLNEKVGKFQKTEIENSSSKIDDLKYSYKIGQYSDSEKIFQQNWTEVGKVNTTSINNESTDIVKVSEHDVSELNSKENMNEVERLRHKNKIIDDTKKEKTNYTYRIGQQTDTELDFQEGWIEVSDITLGEKNEE